MIEDRSKTNQQFRWISLEAAQAGRCQICLELDKVSILALDHKKWQAAFKAHRNSNPNNRIPQADEVGKCAKDLYSQIEHSQSISDCLTALEEILDVTAKKNTDNHSQVRGKAETVRFATLVVRLARDADLLLTPASSREKVAWRGTRNPIRDHYNLKFSNIESENGPACRIFFGTLHMQKPQFINEDALRMFWETFLRNFDMSKSDLIIAHLNKIIGRVVEQAKINNPDFSITRFKRRDFRSAYLLLADNNVWWACDSDHGNEHFIEWRTLLREWLEGLKIGKTQLHNSSARLFIKFLASCHPYILSPSEVRDRHIIPTSANDMCFLDWMKDANHPALTRSRAIGHMREFFGWWHSKHGIDIGNTSRNPFPSDLPPEASHPRSLSKSNKDVLPRSVMRRAEEVILSNNFEFPRSLEMCQERLWDADERLWKNVFNPSLAHLILTLIKLPIRRIQCRLLDSGEADEFRLERKTGNWVKNNHPLATKGRQLGALKEFQDRSGIGKSFVGFYINSDKGSWRSSRSSGQGYSIPWNNESLIGHLDDQIKWQEKWNPIRNLKDRSELECKSARIDGKIDPGRKHAYLFRACNAKIDNEPIGESQIYRFWALVLREVERRMIADGLQVVLTTETSYARGTRITPIFSLHSLRVSGITHFIDAGLPIHVAAEFLSGHASMIMTLYYTKIHPAKIRGLIEDAARAQLDGDDDHYLDTLLEAALQDSNSHFITGQSARSALETYEHPHWLVMADGICPVGGSMCHIGGEFIGKYGDVEKYSPISMNSYSCATCRFRVTGPAFLSGQIVVFNNLLYAIQEKTKAISDLREQLEGSLGKLTVRNAKRNEDELDLLEKNLESELRCLQARANEIYSSLDLLRHPDSKSEGRHSLTTMMRDREMDVVIDNAKTWELIEFAAQTAEFFPTLSPPTARLRKIILLDKMLSKNGYKPLALSVTADEAAKAGNLLTSLLSDLIGQKAVATLMEDDGETLETLGIVAPFKAIYSECLLQSRLTSLSGSDAQKGVLLE